MPPRGFTLVEILVTITILGLLAGMVLIAGQAARTAAQVAKTKATITKINHFVMARYESYRTRRLTLNLAAYVKKNPKWYPNSSPSGNTNAPATPTDMARARVNALRDLMRLEMPDRWNDIVIPPRVYDPNYSGTPPLPVLTQRYYNYYNNIGMANNPQETASCASAKLLYMIVMSDPEAAHQFGPDETGTVDSCGLQVFLDGWKNPIFFLRWPVGFLPSLAANFNLNPPLPKTTCDTDLQTGDAVNDHDPFDPQKQFPNAYAVYPLIYSAGPDGYTDINIGTDGGNPPSTLSYPWGPNGAPLPKSPTGYLDAQTGNFDPYNTDANGQPGLLVGQPYMSAGLHGAAPLTTLSHYDNIHNQHIEAK